MSSPMKIPHPVPPYIPPFLDDTKMLKLAREIAMDMKPLEDILQALSIDHEEWKGIQMMPRFNAYLKDAIETWHGALNTGERVRLKSLAFVEEALPEFFARAHDATEALPAKTEVLKTIARFAGVGAAVGNDGSPADRLSVVINLGADNSVRLEKDITPSFTIQDQNGDTL